MLAGCTRLLSDRLHSFDPHRLRVGDTEDIITGTCVCWTYWTGL